VAILPARAKKPRDKAKVEKAVQEVERQILAPLRHQRFTSFSDLNEAIRERLEAAQWAGDEKLWLLPS
jgi:transposase